MDYKEAFKETRKKVGEQYKNLTIAATTKTKVIADGSKFLAVADRIPMQISAVTGNIINTALTINNRGKIGIVNFSNAESPKAIFTQGVLTQEGYICCCSNLLETLTLKKCKVNYYKNYRDSDSLIYSEGVSIIKNSYFDDMNYPVLVDIITTSVPDTQTLADKLKCIFGTAFFRGVSNLIIGIDENDWDNDDMCLIAKTFKGMIDEYSIFHNLIFSFAQYGDCDSEAYDIFEEVIKS